ncbi:MAG: GntR family transcriptional regulator [Phycisphaerales bacterium]|nr:GntR family transcriptional regulator [Phycisphaerales bacterium]
MLSELKLDPFSSEQLHVQIQKQIREKIRVHRLPAGEELPTNHELSAALNVSYETVQRAMVALADHGIVVRRQRKGTFVNKELSPRTIGIFCTQAVFNPKSSPSTWLLAHHLCEILHDQQRDGQVYYVPAGAEPEHNKTYGDLIRDIEEHRLSGLVFLRFNPDEVSHANLLAVAQRRRIPVVGAIFGESFPYTVYPDYLDFCRRGMLYLAERGCRRVAVRAFPINVERTNLNILLDAATQAGIRMEPDDVAVKPFKSTADIIALGEHWGEHFDIDRYDGVLLGDDIVAVGFARSLNLRNVRVPGQLQVATLWNRGNPLQLAMPFTRFEVNVELWVRRGLETLHGLIEHQDTVQHHIYVKLEGPVESMPALLSPAMEGAVC